MSTELSIRPAPAIDVALLAEMNKRLIEDEQSRNPLSVGELRQRMQRWLMGDWNVDILMVDNMVVGYAVYQLRRDEYEPEQPVVYLRQFYIEREQRGRALGRTGFEALVRDRFPADSTVVIDVLSNNLSAYQFWTKMGFVDYCITMKQYGIQQVKIETHANGTGSCHN